MNTQTKTRWAVSLLLLLSAMFAFALLTRPAVAEESPAQKTMPDIFEAIEKDDLATVKKIVEADPDVVYMEARECTPLSTAVGRGNTEIIKYLIEKGADVNAGVEMISSEGETYYEYPLNRRTYDEEINELLIKAGAHYGSAEATLHKGNMGAVRNLSDERLLKGEYGNSALHYLDAACFAERRYMISDFQKEVMAYLIDEKKLDINQKNNKGETPLHRLLYGRRSKESIQLLLDYQADINAVDNQGQTPLFSTAYFNTSETIQFLIDQGAKADAIDHAGNTIIHHLVTKGSSGVKKYETLIKAGVDINQINNSGKTALMRSFSWWRSIDGTTQTTDILLGLGAETGFPLIDLVIKGDAAGIKKFIAEHPEVDLSELDPFASSPALHWAVMARQPESVRTLIEAGADINVKNKYGSTAFLLAVDRLLKVADRADKPKMFELLIDLGADINMPNDKGSTPVTVAITRKRYDILKVLIAAGAEITAINRGALRQANNEEAAAILLEVETNVDSVNRKP
jgi:FOG: Ankyrin repeat